MSEWCVVNTLPHQEARAELNLLRQGFRAWFPVMARTRRHARKIETIRAPVFPGYLFVELDLDRESWGTINHSFGVRRLLTQDLKPQVVPDGFVVTLRDAIDPDGIWAMPAAELRPGQRVRVASGPFADQVATVVSLAPGDRVRVLLEMLGGAVTTTLPRSAVIHAA
ncbi:MAG: transcriptional activator RfaH [Rhodospirillales bacterium]|nr:MAG: transcriptional activator RfaH [Rhodospirillales bacterium]